MVKITNLRIRNYVSVDVDVVVEGYNNRLAVVEDMSMRNPRWANTAAIATTYDENDTKKSNNTL